MTGKTRVPLFFLFLPLFLKQGYLVNIPLFFLFLLFLGGFWQSETRKTRKTRVGYGFASMIDFGGLGAAERAKTAVFDDLLEAERQRLTAVLDDLVAGERAQLDDLLAHERQRLTAVFDDLVAGCR